MANTRQRDLRGLDPESQEYWEEVLSRAKLGMGRAKSKHLIYVGDSQVLERIEGEIQTDSGEVKPRGARPA